MSSTQQRTKRVQQNRVVLADNATVVRIGDIDRESAAFQRQATSQPEIIAGKRRLVADWW